MPHKNTIRHYATGHLYHIYNRGVEKRKIFRDEADYSTFLSIVKDYLTSKETLKTDIPSRYTPYWRSHLKKNEIELICFCLMPNHLHFLVKQNTKDGITRFMRRICNAFVRYFNKKHERIGTLFQGKFKTVLVETDPYLLHLTRYIHLNPLELIKPTTPNPLKWLQTYPYSSYPEYLNLRTTAWVQPRLVLSFFKTAQRENPDLHDFSSYQSFVESYPEGPAARLADLILESV